MKKYYCFYCQKDVEPRRFLKWSFCPYCRHHMTDKGEGFYRICNYCGANMPTDAVKCVKCGQSTGLPAEKVGTADFNDLPPWAMWLLRIAVFILLLVFSVVILYFSFYLLIAVFVIGFTVFLFNLLLPRR